VEARVGNRAALEILFAGISRCVLRQAHNLCRDADLAQDVAQSALLHVFQHLAQLRNPNKILPWIKTIVLNTHRMAARRAASTPSRFEPLCDETGSIPATSSIRLDAGRVLDIVIHGIHTLPPLLRAAFELRVVQGLSTASAAAALGVTPETVRTRLTRARKLLRQQLESESS
jgi:RNA polymerase sigma-70 factor (ECF subfamily)